MLYFECSIYTHISGRFLKIHVVHVVWHHPCGIVMVTIRLRQLTTELRPNEAQVPLWAWEIEAAWEAMPLLAHTDIQVVVDGLDHGEHLGGAERCVDIQGGVVAWAGQKRSNK